MVSSYEQRQAVLAQQAAERAAQAAAAQQRQSQASAQMQSNYEATRSRQAALAEIYQRQQASRAAAQSANTSMQQGLMGALSGMIANQFSAPSNDDDDAPPPPEIDYAAQAQAQADAARVAAAQAAADQAAANARAAAESARAAAEKAREAEYDSLAPSLGANANNSSGQSAVSMANAGGSGDYDSLKPTLPALAASNLGAGGASGAQLAEATVDEPGRSNSPQTLAENEPNPFASANSDPPPSPPLADPAGEPGNASSAPDNPFGTIEPTLHTAPASNGAEQNAGCDPAGGPCADPSQGTTVAFVGFMPTLQDTQNAARSPDAAAKMRDAVIQSTQLPDSSPAKDSSGPQQAPQPETLPVGAPPLRNPLITPPPSKSNMTDYLASGGPVATGGDQPAASVTAASRQPRTPSATSSPREALAAGEPNPFVSSAESGQAPKGQQIASNATVKFVDPASGSTLVVPPGYTLYRDPYTRALKVVPVASGLVAGDRVTDSGGIACTTAGLGTVLAACEARRHPAKLGG